MPFEESTQELASFGERESGKGFQRKGMVVKKYFSVIFRRVFFEEREIFGDEGGSFRQGLFDVLGVFCFEEGKEFVAYFVPEELIGGIGRISAKRKTSHAEIGENIFF